MDVQSWEQHQKPLTIHNTICHCQAVLAIEALQAECMPFCLMKEVLAADQICKWSDNNCPQITEDTNVW